MQVLVADDEITSRVLVETVLRERGHTVRNCEDGFEAAKLLSVPHAPRIAVISNSLARLRGLDVCRFLCAMGKKTNVYVILVSDSVDMEIVELCRRAGVDDIVKRPLAAAAFHSHLDVAERVVELEDEMRRIQGVLQGLSNFESPLDRKARVLREANSALLDSAKKKGDLPPGEAPAPSAAPNGSARPPEKGPQKVQSPTGAVYRGVRIVPDRESRPAPAQPQEMRSLLGDEPLQPAARSSQKDIDAILNAPQAPAGKTSQKDIDSILFGAPSPAAQRKIAAEAAARSQEPAVSQAAAPVQDHDEAQQAVLAGAAQLQTEELADEELIHPFELDEIILNVFSGMGVTLKTELPPKAMPEGPVFASWVGVAIPEEPVWLDVLLIAGQEGAKAVTRELLGQAKVADSDVCEMFAELQNMVQGSLRRYLEENGHKQVLQLAIPRASRRDDGLPLGEGLAATVESGFSFNGAPINVMLFEHRECSTLTNVLDLHCYDFLCDPVTKPGSPNSILVAGAIVRVREKGIIEGVTGITNPFRAMRASPFARAVGPEKLLDQPGAAPCCDKS